MGGRPNPGTKKDMRLARNNPNAGKKATQAKKPFPGASPPFKKDGK
jgi:hypothetical protein